MTNPSVRCSQRQVRLVLVLTFATVLLVYIFISLSLAGQVVNHPTSKNDLNHRPKQDEKKMERWYPEPKATVAYVWTLAKCSDKQSHTEGLVDAALVLRHSIHQNSIRNHPHSHSQYDYQMMVLVHPNAMECARPLAQAGFRIIQKPEPVRRDEIENDFYRRIVPRAWCCGELEFIKLYAWTLKAFPIVVHMDVDFVLLKPMDDLFNVMLEPPGPKRRPLEQKIHTMFPNRPFPPHSIELAWTRDYQQTYPGQRALFQAGFMVLRPNPTVFDEMKVVLKRGHYVEGWKNDTGWGGLGYSGLTGASGMQGFLAYFYDQFRPKERVLELNMCRYNHMAGDVFWRDIPNWNPNKWPHLQGACRNGQAQCEDCQRTNLTDIFSIHYTNCRKPWNCVGHLWEKQLPVQKQGIDTRNTDYEHCLTLTRAWHQVRTDLEERWQAVAQSDTVLRNTGKHMPHVFMGHCTENGQDGYIDLSSSRSLTAVGQIYKEPWH